MPQAATRYLTKSRFKLALECPTKLYFTGKPDIYPDASAQDEFMQALAEGGFQVGELAKLMFPGGVEVLARDQDQQVQETTELLRRANVTIFEGAIRHGNLFARVDILHKRGKKVQLIEVKAKSFDSTDPAGFRTRKGGIDPGMLPYLQDVAFQRLVFQLAHKELSVTAHLMLADKSKTCSIDGLNQLFKIRRDYGRPTVEVSPRAREAGVGDPVLTRVDVDDCVDEILTETRYVAGARKDATISQLATYFGNSYKKDKRISPVPGPHCAHCEFRHDAPAAGTRSGFHECWEEAFGLEAPQLAKGTVLDLWNFRRKAALIAEGVIEFEKITREHLGGAPGTNGLSQSDQQWMQISRQWPGGDEFYLDRGTIKAEMQSWKYPLHFIDFETARVALPFFAGQRPYENIAFQFSHHTVSADGSVAHESEFLSTMPGQRPNYDFVRALRRALGKQGTVFMWSPHENTTLNAVLKELVEDPNPPADTKQLIVFLKSVTRRKLDGKQVEAGTRAMVDLCKLAERAFFHPSTRGSCSIKKVLPAVLQSSTFLRKRYSKPTYGAVAGIRSLNFVNQVWWVSENGIVRDPYKLLPPVFDDISNADLQDEESAEFGDIQQGGAATTAYARLQFDEIAADRRAGVEAALKRYCELDTLAMVMIYEAWREWT